ncbi:TraR/DksA C4-type zinc finger protein [Roseospirillum parvum]|uniref:DnaK suppressor protein n=1 Tax=Roseospirillum parvum TaxID=83401 RepID=A0A1G8GGY6_9PROT|nr:DnaK suppressor protein [Roseospirillum parvum]
MDSGDWASQLAEADRERAVEVWRKSQLDRPAGDGICQSCDRPIPAARLAALPTATRCAPCQAGWEEER